MEEMNVEEEAMSDWSENTEDEIFKSMNNESSALITDSEDEPLANYQRRVKNQADQTEESIESDDSYLDKDYIPSKEDLNSSDSGSDSKQDLELANFRRNKRGKTIKRKLFKAKRSKHSSPELKQKLKQRQTLYQNIRKRKSILEKRTMEMALKKSKRLHSLKELLRNHHKKRLNNLLSSNGLQRVPVPADGDCFYASLLAQIKEGDSIEALRNKVADHITENSIHYVNFLAEEQNEEARMDLLHREVAMVREKGHWKSQIVDCIPLAVANVLKCQIKIFSSEIANPVYDIKPDLTDYDHSSYIHLAYLKVKDEEHYDGVTKSVLRIGSPDHLASNTHETPKKLNEKQGYVNVTPHKEAVYVSPNKKKPTRKQKASPNLWKRNIRKEKRSHGLAYISQRGKSVPERTIKEQACSNCKFKCSINLTQEERKCIFETYWNLKDYNRQRDYICKTVNSSNPRRITTGRKKASLKFHFVIKDKPIRVCKKFYIGTLGIGKKTIEYALKCNASATYTGTDKRGRTPSANKTPTESEQFVREHIESFPKMESHYVRKQSKRHYLAQDLNVTKMWELYKEICKSKGKRPVSQAKYRKIFCEEYNLSFFKPKKDQCSQCTRFELNSVSGEVDNNLKISQESHLQRKQESREQKARDKMRAKQDKSFYSATFDLQAVLSTPCTLVGELYYKRKLSCYNLSFYSLGDDNGKCYVWDETQGGRGSCEIGTCLITHINSIIGNMAGVKEITFYSDTCGGQNRNRQVVSAYIYAMNKNSSIDIINHKFFEPGHSQMESDSMHALIENTKRKTVVYVPSQWNTVISLARRKKPYVVIPMKYTDFLNLKEFSKRFCPNMKVSTTGVRVNWLKIVWIQIRKESPTRIFLNETFDIDKFSEIKVTKSTRAQKQLQNIPEKLDAYYSQKLVVSESKKADLLSLCKSGLIPEEFHSYYSDVPTSSKKHDCIPMPDGSESEWETDDE